MYFETEIERVDSLFITKNGVNKELKRGTKIKSICDKWEQVGNSGYYFEYKHFPYFEEVIEDIFKEGNTIYVKTRFINKKGVEDYSHERFDSLIKDIDFDSL